MPLPLFCRADHSAVSVHALYVRLQFNSCTRGQRLLKPSRVTTGMLYTTVTSRSLTYKSFASLRCSRCLIVASAPASRQSHRDHEWGKTASIQGRAYATEANVIPKAILIRSPPPPAPTTQGQPPESATSLHYPSTRHDQIDGLLHHFHERVFADDGSCARIPDLYDQLSSQAGKMVDHELPFEDTPQQERRIPTSTKQDGGTWLNSCRAAESRLSSEKAAYVTRRRPRAGRARC